MYINNMMKRIAQSMNEVSEELEGEEITGEDVYEVYKLEMDLLAQEVGLEGQIAKLSFYLQLIEEILGEEEANLLLHSEIVNLLKVIDAVRLGKTVVDPRYK